MGKEYDRIKKNKQHKYTKNQYVEGYVPDGRIRDVAKTTGDIIISTPIVVEEIVRVSGTNYIQTLVSRDTTFVGDYASMSPINKSPIPKTNIIISLNGRVIVPADGVTQTTTSAAWFTSPDGLVVRKHGEVQLGDFLKWNSDGAGTEIYSSDELIIIYEVNDL